MMESLLVGRKKAAKRNILLHFDGVNNSTNFINEYTDGPTISRVDNPIISTTQSKFGGSSGKFNREALIVDTPLVLNGDYTAECWVYLLAYAPISMQTSLFGNANTNQSILSISMSSNGTSNYFVFALPGYSGGLVRTDMLLNRWYHCATSRQGSIYRSFLDGAIKHNLSGPLIPVTVAHLFAGFGDVQKRLSGHADEVRITDGTALYTSPFTPPTVPFTI